ncbi:hypothetical protein POM88_030275 [Heracleum sosnowskyi]|uniref:Uncharacterized protein n=1 Tax=Heracleum sosnowskyi TaxID=360622 RepID=A0AAD8HX28_9APIA|nr:hypothetical protein POM88_030275 [Heracleum sosnowskyi]
MLIAASFRDAHEGSTDVDNWMEKRKFVCYHIHPAGRVYEPHPKPIEIGFGGSIGKKIFLDQDFATVTLNHHAADITYHPPFVLTPNQGFLPLEASVIEVEVWKSADFYRTFILAETATGESSSMTYIPHGKYLIIVVDLSPVSTYVYCITIALQQKYSRCLPPISSKKVTSIAFWKMLDTDKWNSNHMILGAMENV